jgi:hypothetical protein
MIIPQDKRGTSGVLGTDTKQNTSLSPSDGERGGVRGSLEYVTLLTKRCTKQY